MKILDIKKFGPIGRFSDSDIYLIMHALSKKDIIGRRTFADMLGLGEGSVRSILSILKEWGLIDSDNKGVRITDNGKTFIDNIPMCPVTINVPDRYLDKNFPYYSCVLVKNVSSKISDGFRQRDVCLRAGARGSITFFMEDGKIFMPPDYCLDEKDYFLSLSMKNAGMSDGDTLIVCYSDDSVSAACGAVTASLDLI